ncbi:MAG: primosomal protein N' [Crocinitomicaceae bacterium]|nr:primosomal protein N' [Crocinitomicaceae bacterium]
MSERKTYFVDVILPLSLPATYTYRVPFELNNSITRGKRVIVPFGKSKYYTAIVVNIHENVPEKYQAKYVEGILDDRPIVNQKQLKVWHWISDYYMANLGDVMNAALPGNLKLASESKISLHPAFRENLEVINERQQKIVSALEVQEEISIKELGEIAEIKTVYPLIRALIEKQIVIVSEELNNKYSPKYLTFVQVHSLIDSYELIEDILNQLEKSKRNEKQVAALLKLIEMTRWKAGTQSPVLRKQIVSEGISESALNTLAKKDVVEIFTAPVSRLQEDYDDFTKTVTLSPTQRNALEEINHSFLDKDVSLLHGVTGSGKTEIYVKLIEKVLEEGKQVLFLLPEIALTTQLIQRLRKFFGDLVGVYHSKFNQNERVEIWNKVLEDDSESFRIVLGARSSVFLPFSNLGLIIVDEEHESSFKQFDPAPRYNARDTAIMLGKLHEAKVLLGSATPSIETYYNAKDGKYGLIEITERYSGVQMPEIQCADLEKEQKQKTMHSHFSSHLVTQMEDTLKRGEQIILFQNRRGYAPMLMCEMCGWTPECTSCDVSLTYHKTSNLLKCHLCGYFETPPSSCGACGSRKLSLKGFGTEKIDDDLKIIFPDAKTQRLDLDTTRAKNAYQKIIDDFEQGEIDILIGTQMVTKGLDFDNVGLVGILSADQMLRFPDFRAFERSYQLMSQVAGRAGRKEKRGKVIIQAYEPNHWVIQKVMEHNYIDFYNQEILERRNFHYPPFYRMIQIRMKHKSLDKVVLGAHTLAKELKTVFKERILGPETPSIGKIRNQHIQHINIKYEREASPRKVKNIIFEKINHLLSTPDFLSIRIDIDVDFM